MRTDYYIRAVSTVKRTLRELRHIPMTISGVNFSNYSKLREDRHPPKPSRFGERYVNVGDYNFPRWILTKEGEKKLERGDRDGRRNKRDSNGDESGV